MTFLEWLGMVMLVVMLFAIFVGIPISFTLLFLALIFGFIGLGSTVFDLAYLQTLGLMKQDEFVAVPMFIIMGYICDQAGLMERLFKAFRDLFAPVRGALYLVVLGTATLFGIAAGTVGATVALLGIMAGPIMIKTGYDARMSAGAITAGGTLGILIPPSVMLVVMGPVLGVSVLELYAAAFGPGFLLAGMYMVYTMTRSFINPKLGPPVPKEEREKNIGKILWECLVGLVPVTVLTVATLGAILAGLTTSTEAAALGALGAILLVAAYGRLTWKGIFAACQSTLTTTSMVLFLAVASNIFGAVFARLGTATWITNALLAVPLPPWGTISLVLFLIFLLGWPFEWPAIVLIFLPMLAPVATGLGYDMVWFGTITAVVLQTAFLSPPVAMSAYYLKQVVKDWSLSTIYKGMADFMVIQVLCVVVVLAFPGIAMWFPDWLKEGDRMAVPALPGDAVDNTPSLEAGDTLTNDAAGATTAEPEK
ncbi:MAG TPA: TRAP transporter large permease subunit [Burkholderiales bacterium]|nr:TRAP transporter large permease subunit [Burkholderiales bacterium]